MGGEKSGENLPPDTFRSCATYPRSIWLVPAHRTEAPEEKQFLGSEFFPHVFCPDENGRRSGFAIITCFSNPKKLGETRETLNHQGFGQNLAIFRVDLIMVTVGAYGGLDPKMGGVKKHIYTISAARSQHKSLLQSINTRWKKNQEIPRKGLSFIISILKGGCVPPKTDPKNLRSFCTTQIEKNHHLMQIWVVFYVHHLIINLFFGKKGWGPGVVRLRSPEVSFV